MSLSKYSERRACRLLGQSRSTQRYKVRPTSDRDQRLRARVIELARQHPRYGYRRLTHELRRGSWKVNRKCVRRICREEGLKIVRRAKKRRRLGQSKNGVMKLRAERKNHVWSYDFVFDQLENGRAIKILPIVDNFTRECLHIETAHHITGERIVEILKERIGGLLAGLVEGGYKTITVDNGTEFHGYRLIELATGVKFYFASPYHSWERGTNENTNGLIRQYLPKGRSMKDLTQSQCNAISRHVNNRPRKRHGFLTPLERLGR